MIKEVIVDSTTDIAALRKQMRKKLMTGGGVVRLSTPLGDDELIAIYQRYCEEASPYNLEGQVLLELAKYPSLPENLMLELAKHKAPLLARALLERADLPRAIRVQICASEVAVDSQEALVKLEFAKIREFSEEELRSYHLDHQGQGEESLAGRLALCKFKGLPVDILEKLSRDESNKVRFQSRYQIEM